jgi:ATP-dependent Clp protease ATP-binding subunit ClpA
MFELGQELADKLKQLRVRVEIPDGDTIFLRNVPANDRFFNKPRTNLLIKRPREGSPFLVCVDEDLQYTGSDQALVRAFNGSHQQQGWRVLLVDHAGQVAADRVAENALKVLGFDGDEPALQPVNDVLGSPDAGGLIGAFGINLTERVDQGLAEPSVARVEKISEVIACLQQREVRMPIISGASGVGKTNLLHGVARRLRETHSSRELIVVDLGVMMAGTLFDPERENLLSALLKEAAQSPEIILALEHVELALAGVPRGQWLLSQAVDNGVKLIGTAVTETRFDVFAIIPKGSNGPLGRRICLVELAEPWPEELAEILLEHRRLITEHHDVAVNESLFPTVIEVARRIEGYLPAKAIALVDAAASRARLAQQPAVTVDDVRQSAASFRLTENDHDFAETRS